MSNRDDLLEIGFDSNYAKLQAGKDADVVLRIGIVPSEKLIRISESRAVGPHVGLLLDVSGSMQNVVSGNYTRTGRMHRNEDGQVVEEVTGQCTTKLQKLMAAGTALVEHLDSTQLVTIIHFSSIVGDPITERGDNRAALINAIQRAEQLPHRLTNMVGGLQALLKQLTGTRDRARACVLFTDGAPDGGTEPQVLAEATQFAGAGIPLNILGIGDDLRVAFCEQIAAPTGGTVYHIRDVESLKATLAETVSRAKDVSISSLRIGLRFLNDCVPGDFYRSYPQVQLVRKLEVDRSFHEISLGNLAISDGQVFFLTFKVNGSRLGRTAEPSAPLLEATFDFVLPGSSNKDVLRIQKILSLPIAAAHQKRGVVDDQFKMARLKGVEQRFQECCSRGEWDAANHLAAELITGYRNIAGTQAEAAAKAMEAFQKELGTRQREGKGIDRKRIDAILNDISDETSKTAAKRADASITRPRPADDGVRLGKPGGRR